MKLNWTNVSAYFTETRFLFNLFCSNQDKREIVLNINMLIKKMLKINQENFSISTKQMSLIVAGFYPGGFYAIKTFQVWYKI